MPRARTEPIAPPRTPQAARRRTDRVVPTHGEEPGDLEALAIELVETARALTRTAARAAGPGVGRALSMAQLDLLLAVRRRPGQTVTELADGLQLARNTVSTLVTQLVRAGLVLRAGDERDARVARLELTPSAAQRMAGWRARRATAVHQGLDTLSPRELAAVRKALPALGALASAVESAQAGGPADLDELS